MFKLLPDQSCKVVIKTNWKTLDEGFTHLNRQNLMPDVKSCHLTSNFWCWTSNFLCLNFHSVCQKLLFGIKIFTYMFNILTFNNQSLMSNIQFWRCNATNLTWKYILPTEGHSCFKRSRGLLNQKNKILRLRQLIYFEHNQASRAQFGRFHLKSQIFFWSWNLGALVGICLNTKWKALVGTKVQKGMKVESIHNQETLLEGFLDSGRRWMKENIVKGNNSNR